MSYPTSVVPFYGDSIITLGAEGNHYVALRPICAALGIDAKNQREKIQSDERWGDITLPCQTPGGVQEMLCLPLKKLNGWLFSINPNKVRSDLKEKVIQYQEECFEVLFRYWQGEAVSRQAKPQTPYDLIDTQKLKSLQSQSKALAWDYLNSRPLKRPLNRQTSPVPPIAISLMTWASWLPASVRWPESTTSTISGFMSMNSIPW